MKKAKPKKQVRRAQRRRLAVSLGRSPLTGCLVMKPVAKGASISRNQVRQALLALMGERG
jgi:hypothetical protein